VLDDSGGQGVVYYMTQGRWEGCLQLIQPDSLRSGFLPPESLCSVGLAFHRITRVISCLLDGGVGGVQRARRVRARREATIWKP